MTVVADATALLPDLQQLRRDIHRNPEIGLHLPRTQERVLEWLADHPVEVTLGRELSSVTAVIRGQAKCDGPVVLLRADMDALPLVERTGLPFSASGPAMHACGHDLHIAMLAGAARLLCERRTTLAGDVILMFQPGEEADDGARLMLDEGVLDSAGRRPEAAYAIHAVPHGLAPGVFASRPGTFMAASDLLRVTVRGEGGHGSAPHLARDPVPATCEMILALQTFVTRTFDVFDPVVMGVGVMHAGTAYNIIPDEARFEVTVRTLSVESRSKALERSVELLRGIAAGHGLEVDVEVTEIYPRTVNSEPHTTGLQQVVGEHFGEDRWQAMPHPSSGSEDFSRVLAQVPGAMVFLGTHPSTGDPLAAPGNHSPRAVFDDAQVGAGAALLAQLAIEQLRTPSPSS